MKKVITAVLALTIVLTLLLFTTVHFSVSALEASIADTGDSTITCYWSNISTTNNISNSQTVSFTDPNYGSGTTTGGYVLSTKSNSTGYVYAGDVLTKSYVSLNMKSGDHNETQKVNSFKLSDSGAYYCVFYCGRYETRYREGFLHNIPYSVFVEYYYAASAPIYAYKTTLDANGGKSEYDHLITVNTPYIAYQPFETILYTANDCWFPNATREGYTCVGWSKDKNAVSGVWNITPTEDDTYYAVWKKDETSQHTHVPTTLPAVPATCTETGLTKGSYCATCGEILQEQTETPALGHFYETYRVVAPTCQKQGYTIYQCLRCLDFKNDDYTDTVPHKYENGVCIYCNDEAPTPKGVLGDVDSSGETDTVDATYIQRHATRVAVPFSSERMGLGDVDGDGDITVADATFIQRYATHVKTPYNIGEPI